MIGRNFDDPVVQTGKNRWSYKLIDDDNSIKINVEHKLYSPEDISAFVLKELKKNAEEILGKSVEDGVITVPAYFNDRQRQKTMEAAAKAGLNVLRLISEPSAAALAYGLDKHYRESKIVLIYDLGGGTFDVSILKIGEGYFQTLSTSGDSNLGGQDFDGRLFDYLMQKFRGDFNVDLMADGDSFDKRRKDKAKRKLMEKCQEAKHKLSHSDSYKIGIEGLYKDIDYIQLVTRQLFESLNMSLFEITKKCVNDALKEAHLTHNQIDDIVLVGGSTRIPKIRKMIEESFPKSQIIKTMNVDEAVAIGAAIEAARIAKIKPKNFRVTEVTPFSLGLQGYFEGNEDLFEKFIERNTPIPVTRKQMFETSMDNQTAIFFPIFEGENELCKDNNFLGEFSIPGISPLPEGRVKFEVTFAIGRNGILKVSAVDQESGQEKSIEINYGKGRLAGVETRRSKRRRYCK
jgi:molecular chaperone DnaK (HSP70)